VSAGGPGGVVPPAKQSVAVITLTDVEPETEELAYIVSGRGVIRLEDRDVPVAAGQALYVPAKLWHTVVNPGAADLVMVFSFPSPDYPPTERRDSEDPRGE
jgi:mannose-6-phosphate isomerase-like protein (cupin superfamily)